VTPPDHTAEGKRIAFLPILRLPSYSSATFAAFCSKKQLTEGRKGRGGELEECEKAR
jgi:hypothetical protein